MKKRIAAAAIGLAALSLGSSALADDASRAAASAPQKKLELVDAWMGEAVAGRPAPAYVVIDNQTDKPDRLLFITGPAVNHVDIDKVDDSSGTPQTTALDTLVVPAGAKVALDAGPDASDRVRASGGPDARKHPVSDLPFRAGRRHLGAFRGQAAGSSARRAERNQRDVAPPVSSLPLSRE